MDNRPKSIVYVYLTIVLISGLGWYINVIPPASHISYILFFFIFFGVFFFLCMFLFASFFRAMLFSLGVIIIFILRLFGLRSIIYPALLLGCLFFTDRIFRKMKK